MRLIYEGQHCWLEGDAAKFGITGYNCRVSSSIIILETPAKYQKKVRIRINSIDGDYNVETSMFCKFVPRPVYTIWSSDINPDDWRDEIHEICPEITDENDIYDLASQLNYSHLGDERMNLQNCRLPNGGIIVSRLGLWNGHPMGCTMVKAGASIADLLHIPDSVDDMEWTVNANGDMVGTGVHHDGHNHYLYRQFKAGLSEHQIDTFIDKFTDGIVTNEDIKRYTSRLGKQIGKIYGWHFPARDIPELP